MQRLLRLLLSAILSVILVVFLVVFLGLGWAAPHAHADGSWPFGQEPGRGLLSQGKDLYNLGILGAKARDADAQGPAPSEDMGGGTRRFGGGGPTKPPTRLVVELLEPGGPAEAAGLEIGDVIVGVGRGVFKTPALPVLAEALRKAEAGKSKGVLTLQLERAGEAKRVKLDVPLPVAGKSAAKPTQGEGRQRILDAALGWLVERQDADGGYAQTLCGQNGSVVQAAVAGLAWLAGGSDLENGPHADAVAKASTFVAEHAGRSMQMPGGAGGDRLSRMSGMDQTNWGLAHAAIFLGELHARTPKPRLRAALERCAAKLVENQEPSGGWAHGPGGPNPLGYTELNIVTGLALCGIGMAKRAGWEVPEGVLEKAEAYLRASSGGDGGVGYSDQPGQKGMGNIGRTAVAWLGYRVLELDRTEWGRAMGKWVERNAGAVLGGHASLTQHVLLAGVAAHAHGKKAKKAYWEAMEEDLVLARTASGSLQPRPWHESLQMGSNSDVTLGEVWTTAAWAIVLGCEPAKDGRPGLPVWMGLDR